MAVRIVVPELGESILEATVGHWLKKEGDPVSVGDVVVSLETDKVDLEVGAEQAGVLARIERQEGEDVKIGEVLGLIEGPQEVRASGAESSESGAGVGGGAGLPPAVAGASTFRTQSESASDTSVQPRTPIPEPRAPSPELRTSAVAATPSARRLARERDVDLAKIAPGDGSARVTKEEVESRLKAVEVVPPADAVGARGSGTGPAVDSTLGPRTLTPEPGAFRPEERVRMSRRRQTIARRLVEAQHTAAMLTTFNEVDMTAVMELRRRQTESFKQKYRVSLGIASFFVKASVAALRDFPRLNAEIQGEEMVLKRYYDIGVAVGASEGLVVPVLRDADRMSFAEIETAIKDFAKKAEDGTLSLNDLRGGTFTISNGGVFGSLLSTPILNPPQVGILGLHKIQERPVTLNHEIVTRPMMYVALSYDHRIVDGTEAVRFLVRVKGLVEDPAVLLLES